MKPRQCEAWPQHGRIDEARDVLDQRRADGEAADAVRVADLVLVDRLAGPELPGEDLLAQGVAVAAFAPDRLETARESPSGVPDIT